LTLPLFMLAFVAWGGNQAEESFARADSILSKVTTTVLLPSTTPPPHRPGLCA